MPNKKEVKKVDNELLMTNGGVSCRGRPLLEGRP